MDERRAGRVAEAIREELHEILNYELADPRIGTVDVLEVILRPDGRRAVARVMFKNSPEEALQALSGARGAIRRMLGDRIELFRTPDLDFEPAIAPESAAKLRQLGRRIRKGRPRDEHPGQSS